MEYFDLTTPQQNIWNLQVYYSGAAISNLCGATFYNEKRNSAFMQQAIKEFIRNQSGIRLRFCEGEVPRQYVSDEIDENIPVMTFSSMEEFECYVKKFAREPLELTGRFMYRFVVFHVESRSGILVLLSHLISDAWTFGLMAKQLDEAYHKLVADTENISLLKADYVDYIRSEAAYMASDRYAKDRNYWEEKYINCPQESQMKLRSVSLSSIMAKRITRILPLSLEKKIDAFCKTNSVTPAVLFETAIIVYLYKINSQNSSITIGVPVLNRSNVREKEIAGMFVSTMPLTVMISKDMTGLKLVKQITKEHMNIFRHQKYPYENILKFLREKHKISGNLYSAMVSYQNAKTNTQADTKWYSNGYSEIPFVLHIDNRDGNNSHTLNVDFQTDVFWEEEVDYIIKRLEYILEQIIENGDVLIRNIGIVPEQEWKKVIYEFNDTYIEYPKDRCVHELFSEQAEKTPDKIALVFEDKKFTYRQLDEMSDSLAYFLKEKGVRQGDKVAVFLDRDEKVILMQIVVLKLGAIFIPIDSRYPRERIDYILSETNAKVIVKNEENAMSFSNECNINEWQFTKENKFTSVKVNPDDICYIIFTSGSTGVPKGCTLTNRGLVNFCKNNNILKTCNRLESQVCVSVNTISFDFFIAESLLPLANGYTIVLASDKESTDQKLFADLVTKNKVNIIQTTPTRYRLYFSKQRDISYTKQFEIIVTSGEALQLDLLRSFRTNTSAKIFNPLGPSECSVWVVGGELCFNKEEISEQDITIGKPIANTQIYILGRDNDLLPIGVAGELCVAGEGVGKGYLNRPELTAEHFVPNPFATDENHHGKVLYHTGDLACWRADGEIEYLGRIDTQVKIRGLRIELGEIESVMKTMEEIGLVAVADKQDEDNRQYLVGYYTAREEIEEKKLREHLSEKLPAYMIPNHFMRLDHMPMTLSGKIDRKNLPAPDYIVGKKDYIAPVTGTEKKLAALWRQLLRVGKVGKTDDFYELGGDSLLAISMLNEIGIKFGVEISIRDILERSILEQLALRIDQSTGNDRIEILHDDKYVLLPQQKAIYAVYRKNPDTLAYNMPARIYLPENIDRSRLEQSIHYVMECHRILKSRIKTENNEIYGIYDDNISISFEKYRNGNEDAFIRPFQLEKEPLIRVGFTEDSLLFDMHHIITDGTSLNIILRGIIAVYEGKSIRKSGAEYSDYARYFYKLDTSEHKKYFREMLKCDFEQVRLPETKNAGQGGKSKLYYIPEEVFQKAKEYGRKNGLTDTMVFMGAYVILLSKYTAKKNILTSIILQNRIHADIKDMVGMFVNTLPLHLTVKGNTQEFLYTVKQTLLNLFHYQELPFQDIANAVGMKDRTVINTSFVYQGDGEKMLTLDGQELVPQFIDTHTAKFDFSMELTPLKSGCQMRLEYNCSKYDEQLMDKLADAYLRILSQLDKEKIADITVLSEDERHRVIEEFNDTYVEYPRDKCIHELFSEQVRRAPEKVALVFEDKKFTYRQLDEMSNSLAHFLRGKGVKPNDVVPIIAKRSWHVIVAMLGILKAGGAYMPVSPDYPGDRIFYMIRTAQSRIALLYEYERQISIEAIRLNDFNFAYKKSAIENINRPEDSAYVISTSGSTSIPKEITVCHRNVCNYVQKNSYNHVCYALFQNQCKSIVSVTNIVFDIFVTESILPLVNGLCIYLTDEDEAASQNRLSRLLGKNQIDILQTTPTKMKSYVLDKRNTDYLSGLKIIVLGGEVLLSELYCELRKCTGAKIYNIYGPAETTVWSSNTEVTNGNITIGKPIANTQIYILDSDNNPLPIGVAGELCIAGEGVGKGYLNRPELTAEHFVVNPFATEENRHGKIMYHTGDLALWRSDGEIEYLGRIDTQVKIRGLRIELGEIESAMGSMEGIGFTAVADKRDESGHQYLVGCYTADQTIDENELRRHLSAKLPKYMIPNYFVHMDAMPMTVSGKTDRKNLPAPKFTQLIAEYVPPETDIEKKLAEIWQCLLKLEKVGKTDDFFELGGDSLLAISMLNEIENIFHVEISIKEIMEHSELAGMAQCLEKAAAINRIAIRYDKRYALLPQQKAIYAACMKEPDTLVYNMPARISLPDTIDRDRLKASIIRVLSSHRLLESCIRMEATGLYGVYDETARIIFEEYTNNKQAAFVRPFDLANAPLVRIGFTEDALLFDIHHIIADGDSINILLREISSVYEGGIVHKSEINYSDYATYFYNLDMREHKTYLKEMLQCDMEPIVLPETKNPRKGGKSKLYRVPKELFVKTRQYARKSGLTDTMIFLGAYGILLSKYTGKKEVLSSIILQNRTHVDTRDMVGMFVNTLPISFVLGDNVKEYMQEVKKCLLNLFRYQELSFEDISEAAEMDRSIINTSFVYQGDGEKILSLDGERLVPEFIDTHTAKFDLLMELTPTINDCRIRLEYRCEKYDEELMDELADAYIQILNQLDKEKIAEISVLTKADYHKVVEEFNDTFVNYPREKCVHELFAEQVTKTPEQTALVFEDKRFTYRQLDEMSNSLAHYLREKGVRPGDVIPIIAKRSWHVIVGMLGILKAGGAYMPVDPSYPEGRISYMLEISGCKLGLAYHYEGKLKTEIVMLDSFEFYGNVGSIENVNVSKDAAYIIFTSGSTGMPKGIIVCHQNICNYVNDNNNNVCHKIIRKQYKNIVSITNIIFDIFVTESLLPLLNGMCIYLANDMEAVLQEELSRLFERNQIDVLQATPTKMRSLILDRNNTGYLRNLKVIILGGEAFPSGLYHELRDYTDAQIFNIYGPAETTVWSTNAEITGKDITIGKPIANTQIYILDYDGQPLPIGVAGELCIAGDGVGKGYLKRPELTEEKFVYNPFATEENHHGKVMYHTGDLARWRSDGEIEYLGRIDTQVKIRGLRIELEEIESVMSSVDGVGLAAVAGKSDGDGRQYLVGYYTADKAINERELRHYLVTKLPKYMIPNYFMHLDAMPMTASGKTDRKKLPVPVLTGQATEYAPPVTAKEKTLCHLLEELLHMERVGTQDDFFENGGDSLTAIEYTAKAHSAGINFSLQNVFDYPTVQLLCDFLEKGEASKINYRASDFDKYQKLFETNKIEESFAPKKKVLGNILLTGVTGFLGAHVLDALMREEAGKIYCLVRSEKRGGSHERVHRILQYYFGNQYDTELGKRIILIEGDIERENLSENMPEDVQTVIHTAASVSHYGSYGYFYRVNVEGTRHVVNYAKQAGAKLIHISTLSVSGNSIADDFMAYHSEEEKFFDETSLYIDQPLDNVYIRSKFEAERAVYDAMLEGLDAKVIRVGNLTNRAADHKFQPNYRENAFLTIMKAILEFGLFPDYLVPLYSEFSPVDLTAEGIVKIACYADRQCIFHLNSNRPICFDRFLEVVHELDIPMKVVDGAEFGNALEQTMRSTGTEYIFEALQNDMDEKGRLVYDSNIRIVNDFTVWFLRKVGFEWNEIDMEYLRGYIEYFRRIGYLEV